VQFDLLSPEFSATPAPVRHEVALHILDPLRIVQDQEPWTICCELDPLSLPSQTYTLFNDHATDSVPVSIAADVDWLDVSPGTLTVPPRGSADVTVSLNANAIDSHGDYPADVVFVDELTGEEQTRRILLQIREDLSLIPVSGFRTAARSGARPDPAYAVYTIRNPSEPGGTGVPYRARVDQPWILIDESASIQGIAEPQEEAPVVITLELAALPQIPLGERELTAQASLTLENLTSGETTTRTISLTLVNPHFTPSRSLVSREVRQPGGPEYSFMMGTYSVTNAEFVAFLNDALGNPTHQRGEYLWFDVATGDVYLNTEATGRLSAVPTGTAHRLFSPSVNSQVDFDGTVYSVITAPVDYAPHPVSGVSWYGAAKYCNWLTLDQGFLPEERCYAEAPLSQAELWRPVSIAASDWTGRDLNDTERWNLVAGCHGFRLPMDDGYSNTIVTADATDAYNEWFKAAAWNEALSQNTLYGFGRGVLTPADANFRCSDDPFELVAQCTTGSTTPVGYYDGSIRAGGFFTTANANYFGLFDMSGNVDHWLQDRFAPPATLNRRTLRGGSWNDPIQADSLKTTSRVLFAAPDTLSHQIGFRVVQVPPIGEGDFNRDGTVSAADLYPLSDCPSGPGQAAAPQCAAFDFDQDGDVDLADYAELLPLVTVP
jgi:formylglycine-generating enzyme required for sulfatase activity